MLHFLNPVNSKKYFSLFAILQNKIFYLYCYLDFIFSATLFKYAFSCNKSILCFNAWSFTYPPSGSLWCSTPPPLKIHIISPINLCKIFIIRTGNRKHIIFKGMHNCWQHIFFWKYYISPSVLPFLSMK